MHLVLCETYKVRVESEKSDALMSTLHTRDSNAMVPCSRSIFSFPLCASASVARYDLHHCLA